MPADTDRLEVYEAGDGWRWRRVAVNHRTLCTGEQHTREADAWRAAHRACPDLDPDWRPVPMPVAEVDDALSVAAGELLAARGGDDEALAAARARLAELVAR